MKGELVFGDLDEGLVDEAGPLGGLGGRGEGV